MAINNGTNSSSSCGKSVGKLFINSAAKHLYLTSKCRGLPKDYISHMALFKLMWFFSIPSIHPFRSVCIRISGKLFHPFVPLFKSVPYDYLNVELAVLAATNTFLRLCVKNLIQSQWR